MGVDVLGPWVVGGGALALTAAVVAPTPWDRRTLRAGAGLLVAACGMAVWALVSLDLRLELVAGHTTRSTAAPLRVAGLWGGSAGSLLLFSTLLAAVAAVGRREAVPRRSMAFAAAGFASITAVAVRPFERLPAPVLDGAGLVPVLRRGSMLIHPPVLYLGLVLLVVPLGLGVAQLREPAVDRQRAILRSTAAAWAVLTAGMALGAHWAAAEVGWGGIWAWDPVEDAALLPWLAATAVLHLGRRGQGRAAAYGSIAAFGLAGLGAWIGRSGTLTSVHAFADARAVGWGVLALLAVGAVVVVVARRPSVADAEVGRRAWVVPAVFAGVGVVVLAGTLWPLVPLLVGGERRVVAGTYFAAFAAPAALGLLALLGVRRNGPAVAALVAGVGAALALRLPPYAAGVCALGPAVMVGLAMQRRRTGVLLAHAGAVVLLAGVAGATLATRQTAAIVPGDHARLAGVSVTSAGTASISTSSRTGVAAVLDIDGHELRPALVRVPGADGVRGDVALRSTPARDVQISLERTEADGTVVVTVTNRPLAQAVWWGAALLAVGGALTVRRPRRPAAEPAPDPALAAA